MDDDRTRTDFDCFHQIGELCEKCRGILAWQRTWAKARTADEQFYFWPEETLAKLRLIQDQTHEVIKRETQRPEANLPPLTPMPDCDLCRRAGCLLTPDNMSFCGDCWRAHRIIQEQRRRFEQIEAESLIEPESR